MMVGNDQVEPQTTGLGGLRHRTNPRIHADHQPDAFARRGPQHTRLHPVALADAVGHVVAHLRWPGRLHRQPHPLDRGLQQHGRRRAIHIVVTVDEDWLGGANRGQNPFHRRRHAQQPHRIAVGILPAAPQFRGWKNASAVSGVSIPRLSRICAIASGHPRCSARARPSDGARNRLQIPCRGRI